MEDILELKEKKRAMAVLNPHVEKYEHITELSKKAKEARETLERCPPPAKLLLKRYSKTEQEEGISISGVLKRANEDTYTFMVVKMEGVYDIHYHIRTTPDTLNQLVKNYWGETINVRIRPQINSDNQFEYELMAVN
jgi:hypothetical protein